MAGFPIIIKKLLPVSDLFILLKRLCVYDYEVEAQSVRDLIKQFSHFRQAQKCFSFSFRKNTEGLTSYV
jgi:hypothetical protein